MLFSWKYRFLLILGLSVYSYLNIFYTVGERLFDFSIPYFVLFFLLFVVVFGIWELNRLSLRLIPFLPRSMRAVHPLILLFVFSLVSVVLVTASSLFLLYAVLGMPLSIDVGHLKLLMAFGFRVNLFLNCVNAIVFYMTRYREVQVEAERLKKISVEARFEALRSQINPHFLFNCFSALSSLVYKDADMSARFIFQLSNVYRYLLYNQHKKVVTLLEELQFLESYFYLIRIRFGDNIIIKNNLAVDGYEDEALCVPPSVLQLLVENAIKHNVVSRKDPLTITLSRDGDFLEVKNTLKEKTTREESTNVGLKNILDRYRLLSDKQVMITRDAEAFVVRVPLLKLELHESTYR